AREHPRLHPRRHLHHLSAGIAAPGRIVAQRHVSLAGRAVLFAEARSVRAGDCAVPDLRARRHGRTLAEDQDLLAVVSVLVLTTTVRKWSVVLLSNSPPSHL